MKRQIVTTGDGATTIFLEEWNEHYHSKHGAINESLHVFIKNGLQLFSNREISILEIGFGTGLNAFITLLESPRLHLKINYKGVEAYPINEEEVAALNYISLLDPTQSNETFEKLHRVNWEENHKITSDFCLRKEKKFFQEISDENSFNLIYFDAFGARVQPELWTEAIFQKMYVALKANGVLVTYSAKGSVRRAMQSCGFYVERLEGPPGKREMLRATKQ
ncbi:tRNA (5-methylaminomethyl-2-thiouridine)(34)-methyltransferase MnmD [Ascidiimonas sp. W6]|uniref:tRNA (5-methylaminomethyl-2-thiouridine)(34)-methyltransferase MnmD n=1 Tax=Ascidiimonas meishanensis TaxID=3128903 RepID=UPI0030EB31A6